MDPRGKWYLRSRSHFSFGTSLHNVLQRFHDSRDTGVTTTAQAVAALEESWIEAGYNSQEDMLQALSEGKDILEAYTTEVLSQPVTSQTLFVEKLFRYDLGDFVLIGRIDRIDQHEDGHLDIIDYKSGRSSVNREQLENDIAMGIYQLILKHHFPDREITATIIAIRTGDSETVSLNPDSLQLLENDLKTLGEEILNRDWQGHTPSAKPLCPQCDFLNLCQKQREFHEQYQEQFSVESKEVNSTKQ